MVTLKIVLVVKKWVTWLVSYLGYFQNTISGHFEGPLPLQMSYSWPLCLQKMLRVLYHPMCGVPSMAGISWMQSKATKTKSLVLNAFVRVCHLSWKTRALWILSHCHILLSLLLSQVLIDRLDLGGTRSIFEHRYSWFPNFQRMYRENILLSMSQLLSVMFLWFSLLWMGSHLLSWSSTEKELQLFLHFGIILDWLWFCCAIAWEECWTLSGKLCVIFSALYENRHLIFSFCNHEAGTIDFHSISTTARNECPFFDF